MVYGLLAGQESALAVQHEQFARRHRSRAWHSIPERHDAHLLAQIDGHVLQSVQQSHGHVGEPGPALDGHWTRRLPLHGPVPTLQRHVDVVFAVRTTDEAAADTLEERVHQSPDAVSWAD